MGKGGWRLEAVEPPWNTWIQGEAVMMVSGLEPGDWKQSRERYCRVAE